MADNLVRVGVEHSDQPGSVAAISSALAEAQFNVITSILRKQKNDQNVWEALLENRQAADPVPSNDPQEQLFWIQRRICAVASGKYVSWLADRHVRLTQPAYPPTKQAIEPVTFSRDGGPTVRIQRLDPLDRIGDQIRNASNSHSGDNRDRLEMLQVVQNLTESVVTGSRLPMVFLSLPRALQIEGERLKQRLDSTGYNARIYLAPDGQPPIKAVIDLIHQCDFFAGIWQGAPRPQGGVKQLEPYTSAWLPFELGVARAFQRPWAYVAASQLDKLLVSSLADGTTIPTFDLTTQRGIKDAFSKLEELIQRAVQPKLNHGKQPGGAKAGGGVAPKRRRSNPKRSPSRKRGV